MKDYGCLSNDRGPECRYVIFFSYLLKSQQFIHTVGECHDVAPSIDYLTPAIHSGSSYLAQRTSFMHMQLLFLGLGNIYNTKPAIASSRPVCTKQHQLAKPTLSWQVGVDINIIYIKQSSRNTIHPLPRVRPVQYLRAPANLNPNQISLSLQAGHVCSYTGDFAFHGHFQEPLRIPGLRIEAGERRTWCVTIGAAGGDYRLHMYQRKPPQGPGLRC